MYGLRCLTSAGLLLSALFYLPSCSDEDGNAGPSETPDAAPPDGGADARADAPPEGSAADGDSGSCTPAAGEDLPDDDFQDTNCDGIDGDASAAIFVSPDGSDGAVGTRAAPVRTITNAIALAEAQGKAVYVCNGTYAENVSLVAEAVSLHGGFDCSQNWKRVPDQAVIAPTSGTALSISAVESPIVIERLAFRAPSTTTTGESSMAAVVVDSTSVRFSRVELVSGDAGDGAPGAEVADPDYTPARKGADAPDTSGAGNCSLGIDCRNEPTGTCATQPSGGAGPEHVCPNGDPVRGGLGGKGANYRYFLPGPYAGEAGTPPAAGLNGSDAAEAEASAAATSGFGSVDHGRYVADNRGADGTWGGSGKSGTGGEGGSSRCQCIGDVCGSSVLVLGGGGGQGGYGGCGGPGGNGGGAGGASIALLSAGSTIELTWCRVLTGRGGEGGASSAGRRGQPGGEPGNGGAGTGIQAGQPGGRGGAGGRGGDGGPGGGGPSIGIVHVGTAPTLDNTSFQLGTPGAGAIGPNTGIAADGVRAEVYDAS